ncbi:hypothetical protein ACFLXJ_05350 [Chloroflexota bacterium]
MKEEIGMEEDMIWIVRAGEGRYLIDQFLDRGLIAIFIRIIMLN